MSENLEYFKRALADFDATVARVPEPEWDAESPCEGWSARELVGHQTSVLDEVAHMAAGGDPRPPRMPEDLSDPVGLWQRSLAGVLAAVETPGALERHGNYWFGEMTIDELIAVVQWDPVTHTWDLANAVGIEPLIDSELVDRTMATIEPLAEQLRSLGLISEPIGVSPDADALSRYLGLVGRNLGAAASD